MVLDPSSMPTSFTGQALLWAAQTHILNPPNNNQGPVQRFVGKPLRAIARLIYQIAVGILIAPLGVLYHIGAAITYKVMSIRTPEGDLKERKSAIAWEHFKAAMNDILGFPLARTPFFLDPKRSVSAYFSSTEVKVDNPIRNPNYSQENYEILKKVMEERKIEIPPSPSYETYKGSFQQNLYRQDELVLRSLGLREMTSFTHRLDDEGVLWLSDLAAWQGTYGMQS